MAGPLVYNGTGADAAPTGHNGPLVSESVAISRNGNQNLLRYHLVAQQGGTTLYTSPARYFDISHLSAAPETETEVQLSEVIPIGNLSSGAMTYEFLASVGDGAQWDPDLSVTGYYTLLDTNASQYGQGWWLKAH